MSTPANMLPPPGTDPQDWARLQRQSMVANALMENAMTPPTVQQPQGSNRGFYQAARVSPLSGLAKIAEAVMGRRAIDSSNTNMAQAYARALSAFAPGGGSQSPAPASVSNPQQTGTPSGYGGGAGMNDAGQPYSTANPAPRPTNPLNPFGQDPRALFRLYMSDPAKYLDQVKGTPEWQNALAANGGNVTAAEAALRSKLSKEGTLDLRPGGEAMIPDPTAPGGYRSVKNPNLPTGMDFVRDASGNPIPYTLPGVLDFEQSLKRAQDTGAAQGSIHEFATKGGGERYTFGLPPDLAGAPRPGAPPAAAPPPPAAGTPAAPPPKQFFPNVTPASLPSAPPPQAKPTPPGVTPGIWSTPPQRPNTQAGLGTDPYMEGTVKKMVEKNDELSNKYGQESDLADQRIAFNNEALKVLNNAEMGPLSDRLTKIRKMAIESGVPASWIPGGDKVNSTDELKKFALRNPLLSLKPTFGGRPAASEFQILANDASPSPLMLQGAFTRLVQLDNQAAGFAKQRATDYSYYHDQLNGNPQRFETWYSNKVPFAKWLGDNPTGRPGEQHVDTTPRTVVQTGMYNGRRVQKMSDGSVEYAQ